MGDCCAAHAKHWGKKRSIQKVTLPSLLSELTDVAFKLIWVLHRFESASRRFLNHGPSIMIIGIQVLKVMTFFPRIEPVTHVLIVHPRVPINYMSDATSSTSLKHQQHIRIS